MYSMYSKEGYHTENLTKKFSCADDGMLMGRDPTWGN